MSAKQPDHRRRSAKVETLVGTKPIAQKIIHLLRPGSPFPARKRRRDVQRLPQRRDEIQPLGVHKVIGLGQELAQLGPGQFQRRED